MRGYPNSRGSKGETKNTVVIPSNQTTFETTEPLNDPSLPIGGLRLTEVLENVPEIGPPVPIPDSNAKREEDTTDYDPINVSPLELDLKTMDGDQIGKGKFIVTNVKDSNFISLRSLKYNNASFEKLEQEMRTYYNKVTATNAKRYPPRFRIIDIHEDGSYAAKISLKDQGLVWARVRVNDKIYGESRSRPIKVDVIDYGLETTVLPHKMYLLTKEFANDLPQVGLKFKLKRISKSPSDRAFDDKLEEILLPGTEVDVFAGSVQDKDSLPTITAILFFASGVPVEQEERQYGIDPDQLNIQREDRNMPSFVSPTEQNQVTLEKIRARPLVCWHVKCKCEQLALHPSHIPILQVRHTIRKLDIKYPASTPNTDAVSSDEDL